MLKLVFFSFVMCLVFGAPASSHEFIEKLRAQAENESFIRALNKSPLDKTFRSELLASLRNESDRIYYGKRLNAWKLGHDEWFSSSLGTLKVFKGSELLFTIAKSPTVPGGVLINGKQFVWNPAQPLQPRLEKFIRSNDEAKSNAGWLFKALLPEAFAILGIGTFTNWIFGGSSTTAADVAALYLIQTTAASPAGTASPAVPTTSTNTISTEVKTGKDFVPLRSLELLKQDPSQPSQGVVTCDLTAKKSEGVAWFGSVRVPHKRIKVPYVSALDGSLIFRHSEKPPAVQSYKVERTAEFKKFLKKFSEKSKDAISEWNLPEKLEKAYTVKKCEDADCKTEKVMSLQEFMTTFMGDPAAPFPLNQKFEDLVKFANDIRPGSVECTIERALSDFKNSCLDIKEDHAQYFSGEQRKKFKTKKTLVQAMLKEISSVNTSRREELRRAFDTLGGMPDCCSDGTCKDALLNKGFDTVPVNADPAPPAVDASAKSG